MNYNNQHYKIALTLLQGIGPIKAKELLKNLDSLEDIFSLSINEIVKKTGASRAILQKMEREKALEKALLVVEHQLKNNISTHFYSDNSYPRRLSQCIDAPILLYGQGEYNLNNSKVVAIVGTRNATPYGKKVCDELIESFVGNNVLVISGLASGIDSHVHKRCLELNVPTIGVLGHGFDRIYPAHNKSLSEHMKANGGLLTEFIPGTNPDRENFPKRNRIVAGMSDATIVVESKIKGGSLITANLANDYNRDVFACPGSIYNDTSQGCNRLIADQKAHLFQSPNHFLAMMNWKTDEKKSNIQKSMFVDLSEIQSKITKLISEHQSIQIDILSLKAELPISQLNNELFHLEMNGVIQSLPGKKYTMV